METFEWCPYIGAAGSSTLRVRSVQFGDGYEQVFGDGLNPETQSWPLSFVGRGDEVRPIRDFLQRHGGHRAFRWTPPLGVLGLYRCAAFDVVANGGDSFTLNATFVQAYHP